MATRLSAWLRQGWRAIRQLSGDDAYERYLAHHADCHAHAAVPLSRKEFFRQQQQAKWGGIRRCC
jgi:uncharacterized short protein YbdD (DUF466 family)